MVQWLEKMKNALEKQATMHFGCCKLFTHTKAIGQL